jgi:hypothetical protein
VPWIDTARTRGAASKMSSGRRLRVMIASIARERTDRVGVAVGRERYLGAALGEPALAGGIDRIGEQDLQVRRFRRI